MEKISAWQTYDTTDIRKLTTENYILQKIINIGIYFVLLQALLLIILIIYMCIQGNFDFILYSDGTEKVCTYTQGK